MAKKVKTEKIDAIFECPRCDHPNQGKFKQYKMLLHVCPECLRSMAVVVTPEVVTVFNVTLQERQANLYGKNTQ